MSTMSYADPLDRLMQERADQLAYNYSQYQRPTARIQDIGLTGVPLYRKRDTWWGGQMENRFRLAALDSIKGEATGLDFVFNDLFTIFFSAENVEDLSGTIVLNRDPEGLVQSNVDPSIKKAENDLTLKDIKDFVDPTLKYSLDYYNYDWEDFESQDFSVADGLDRIRRDLLQISLSTELENSADTFLEKSTGVVAQFVAGFADPTIVLSGGTTVAGKALAKAALKGAAKAKTASRYQKAVLNTAGRFGRNKSISGSLMDNAFTQNHAAITLALDAGVSNTLLDLGLQYKEGEIFDLYYGDIENDGWWSPERSVMSFGLGTALGYTVGKLFRVDSSSRAAYKHREELIDAVAVRNELNLTPAERKSLHRQFDATTWSVSKHPLPDIDDQGNVVMTDFNIQKGMLDDVLEGQTRLYDDGRAMTYEGQTMTRADYIRYRLNVAIEAMQRDFTITDHQLNLANGRFTTAAGELDDIELQISELDIDIQTLNATPTTELNITGVQKRDQLSVMYEKRRQLRKAMAAPKQEMIEAEKILNRIVEVKNAENAKNGVDITFMVNREKYFPDKETRLNRRKLDDRLAYVRDLKSRKRNVPLNTRRMKILDTKIAEKEAEVATLRKKLAKIERVELKRPRIVANQSPEQQHLNFAYRLAEFLKTPRTFSEVDQFLDTLPKSVDEIVDNYRRFDAAYQAAHTTAMENGHPPGTPEYEAVVQAAYRKLESRIKLANSMAPRGKNISTTFDDAVALYNHIDELWDRVETGTVRDEDLDAAFDLLDDRVITEFAEEAGIDLVTAEKNYRADAIKLIADLTKQANRKMKAFQEDTALSIQRIKEEDSTIGKFANEVEARMILGPSERSEASARRLMTSLYIQNGAPRVFRNNTLANKIFYNNFFNNVSGVGTYRPQFEQVAKESAMVYNALSLLGEGISSAAAGHNNVGREMIPSLEMVRFRNMRLQKRIYQADVALLKASGGDNATYIKRRNAATQAAAGLDSGKERIANDPEAKALADEITGFYQYWENKAVKAGMMTSDGGPYVHTQISAGAGKNTVEAVAFREKLTEAYSQHLQSIHDPFKVLDSNEGTFKVQRSVLVESGVMEEVVVDGESYYRFRDSRVGALKTVEYVDRNGVKQTLEGGLDKDFTINEVASIFKDHRALFDLEIIGGKNFAKLYKENFVGAMRKEAAAAVQNKIALDGNLTKSQGATTPKGGQRGDSARIRAEQANTQRKIPLSVMLSDEMLDTGMVYLDPSANTNHYWFSIAGDVALQSNVDAVTGTTGISYEAYLRTALDSHRAEMGAKNKNYTPAFYRNIEDHILQVRDTLIGRSFTKAETDSFGTGILQAISLATSIPVNAGIGVLMPGTELSFPALLHTLVTKNHKEKMRAMFDALKTVSKEKRDAIGATVEHAQRSQRILHDSAEFDHSVVKTRMERFFGPWAVLGDIAEGTATPRSYRASSDSKAGRLANLAIGTLEAASDTTRFLSGELFWTAFGRSLFGQYHANLAQRQVDKIEAAIEAIRLIGPNPTEKQLRGVARKVGLDFGDLTGYMESGLIDLRTADIGAIRMLKKLAEDNKTDFGDYDTMVKLISTLGSDEFPRGRKRLAELYERIIDHTRRQVDRDITSPRTFDRPQHSQNAIIATINRYLSFARGIRNGRLADLANAGSPQFLAGYTGLMLSEVVTRSLSSMIFKGESADEIMEKWDEEPEKMLLYSLASVPVAGGGQSALVGFMSDILLNNPRTSSYISTPAISIFNSQMGALNKALRAPFSDEVELTDREVDTLQKSTPFINHPITQILLEWAKGGDLE